METPPNTFTDRVDLHLTPQSTPRPELLTDLATAVSEGATGKPVRVKRKKAKTSEGVRLRAAIDQARERIAEEAEAMRAASEQRKAEIEAHGEGAFANEIAEKRDNLVSIVRQLCESGLLAAAKTRRGDVAKFGEALSIEETPIADFPLSDRTRNVLNRMNIRTIRDLQLVTVSQLLASKNFGESSLKEVQAIMSRLGFRIGQALDPEIYSSPVQTLLLSTRTRKVLKRLGIETIGELLTKTADELLEAKRFGMTSLNEIRDRLALHDLKLRGD